ncbi:ribonuclease catalytic domain-containing protein [Thermodesulfatator atlanticus]|uniref:ribonuclease catalytic domain-containing protein n=1 Tax=Thermodesulfatator atlanticus TaxID=501497 RepID=UPI0003B41231|nr:ribonuclease catalytic domain-containing protein [Thermodesulfatator atlanticus]
MKEKDLTGHLIEFAEQGRTQTAYCLGHKDRRLRVLLASGREELLPRTRILHVSKRTFRAPHRQEQLEIIKSADARREKLKDEIDLETLWELIVDDTEEISPDELAEVYFGEGADDDHAAALIRKVLEDRLYFRFREGNIVVHSREEVSRLKEARRKEEERLARREKGALWLRSLLEGKEVPLSDEIKDFWLRSLKEFLLFGDEANHAKETKDLLKSLGAERPGKVFKILVSAGVFSEDENLELLRFDIKEDFPEEVEREAQEIVAKGFDREGREDLTHLFPITIDGPETRDFDDAIHFCEREDGLEIGIHIADVSAFVPPGSRLFKEALNRGATIYLPDRIIPMLPRIISEEAASLIAGKERPALSFLATLSPDGELKGFRIVRSVVKVAQRLTYDEADTLLDKELAPLYEFSQKLFKRRLKAGALPVYLPEISLRVEDGHIILERIEITGARFLVSEYMILANFIAAKFLKDKQVPAIYRSQPKPKERIISGHEQDLYLNFLQLRHMSRGEMHLSPEFHHGLGLPCYTTVTSPIRRAVDLIMEHQLCHFLRTGKLLFSVEEIEEFLKELSRALEVVNTVKNRTYRYWLLKYLKENARNQKLDALVIDIHQRKAKVLILDYMITVDIPLPPTLKLEPGTKVQVVLKGINPREDNIKAFLAH